MKQVSPKLLIIFSLVCGIFFFAESGFCAPNTVSVNKSSTFSTKLSKSTPSSSSASDSALAAQIRAQRAARDARDAQDDVATRIQSSASSNNCDVNLRKCIESRCGGETYSKCATDSDTIFSDKLNACRKDANCTAHEFTLFTTQIKEDKKQAITLSLYNETINCGNAYNDCIITECGKKFDKCLSKSAGDKAIDKCKSIAKDCTEADSGLTSRIGRVFGIVRTDAEKQIKADEQKLYTLRDQMRSSCSTLGALFDERSLDCVFTVNFFSGEDQSHPTASKKLYAGSLFDCTPDWFGIDVTTFKENAYRATRAQSAASSAMLGSGVGTAVGALTSGAIDRAIDSKKAKDALEDACADKGQKMENGKCVDLTDEEKAEKEAEEKAAEDKCKAKGKKMENGKCVDLTDEEKKEKEAEQEAIKKKRCEESGSEYIDGKCKGIEHLQSASPAPAPAPAPAALPDDASGDINKSINKLAAEEDAAAKKRCEESGGTYSGNNECQCDANKGLMKSNKYPGTCNCKIPDLRKGTTQTPALNKSGICSFLYSDDVKQKRKSCEKYGSSKLTDTGCSCPSSEHFKQKNVSGYEPGYIQGYFSPYGCDCQDGYTMENYKCVSNKTKQKLDNALNLRSPGLSNDGL